MSEMHEEAIREAKMKLVHFLDTDTLERVAGVLSVVLRDYKLEKECTELSTEFAKSNAEFLQCFLLLKRIKGCSPKTLNNYEREIKNMLKAINKPVPQITTNDIRAYIAWKEQMTGCTKSYQDTIRRYATSFFGTLCAEGYITGDPAKKIDKIKSIKKAEQALTELELEKLRAHCKTQLHRAIVEVLYSTGCRVGELCGMNRCDLVEDRILVHGKGGKDRWVFLNARAQVELEKYLKARVDDREAMFVSWLARERDWSDRMSSSGIESFMRSLGKKAGVQGVHPHRFRRTTATMALRRGMPIDQVRQMLGHESIATTQIYAITDAEETKRNHGKYVT